jgi:hypothetical protein
MPAGDLELLKERLGAVDEAGRPAPLLPGAGREAPGGAPALLTGGTADAPRTLPSSHYLSLVREFKPPLEMYQPGSGVAIIVGAPGRPSLQSLCGAATCRPNALQ